MQVHYALHVPSTNIIYLKYKLCSWNWGSFFSFFNFITSQFPSLYFYEIYFTAFTDLFFRVRASPSSIRWFGKDYSVKEKIKWPYPSGVPVTNSMRLWGRIFAKIIYHLKWQTKWRWPHFPGLTIFEFINHL